MKSFTNIHLNELKKLSKNFFLCSLYSFCSVLVFLLLNSNSKAQAVDCPQLGFEYDESGNRIKREYKIEPCSTFNNPNLRVASIDTMQIPFSSLMVYPNPVFDNLTIESKSDYNIDEVFIYDSNSKEIYKSKYAEKRIIVPLQVHRPGIYFVNISRNNIISTYKIVKK